MKNHAPTTHQLSLSFLVSYICTTYFSNLTCCVCAYSKTTYSVITPHALCILRGLVPDRRLDLMCNPVGDSPQEFKHNFIQHGWLFKLDGQNKKSRQRDSQLHVPCNVGFGMYMVSNYTSKDRPFQMVIYIRPYLECC